MINVLDVVKVVSISQLILIVVAIILIYITKIILVYKARRDAELKITIQKCLNNYLFENKNIENMAEVCKKSAYNLLVSLNTFDQKIQVSDRYQKLISDLSIHVFKPKARVYFKSYHWFNRYIAALCYIYGYDEEDKKNIVILMQDKVVVVSMNASIVAVKHRDAFLINAMLDVLCKARRLQQSAFIDVVLNENIDISSIIIKRLLNDEDIFLKRLCYKILAKLRPAKQLVPCVQEDLALNNKELSMAIIVYVSRSEDNAKHEIIYHLAKSGDDDIQASIAKALGKIHSEKSFSLLEEMIKSLNWWVRINAANSLKNLGEEGIAILKRQSPEIDQYAYETAQSVLMQTK